MRASRACQNRLLERLVSAALTGTFERVASHSGPKVHFALQTPDRVL